MTQEIAEQFATGFIEEISKSDSQELWQRILDAQKIVFYRNTVSINYEMAVKTRITKLHNDIFTFWNSLSRKHKQTKIDMIEAELDRLDKEWRYPVIPMDDVQWDIDRMKWAHRILLSNQKDKLIETMFDLYFEEGNINKEWLLKFIINNRKEQK